MKLVRFLVVVFLVSVISLGVNSARSLENELQRRSVPETSFAKDDGPGMAVQGSFSYTEPDGEQFIITYTADETTLQPILPETTEALKKKATGDSAGYGGDGEAARGLGSAGSSEAPKIQYYFNNPNSGDGFYEWRYKTDNGISAEESRHRKSGSGASVQGSYSYISPEGENISLFYTADEKGFVPHGTHLPTLPPIPPEILEALKKNAADEAAGIFDDRRYRKGDGTKKKNP